MSDIKIGDNFKGGTVLAQNGDTTYVQKDSVIVAFTEKGTACRKIGSTSEFFKNGVEKDNYIGLSVEKTTDMDLAKIEKKQKEIKEQAIRNYEEDMKTGKLKFVDDKKWFDFFIVKKAHYLYTPDSNGEAAGKIKNRFNLPSGIFAKQLYQAPGDRDRRIMKEPLEIDLNKMRSSIDLPDNRKY